MLFDMPLKHTFSIDTLKEEKIENTFLKENWKKNAYGTSKISNL